MPAGILGLLNVFQAWNNLVLAHGPERFHFWGYLTFSKAGITAFGHDIYALCMVYALCALQMNPEMVQPFRENCEVIVVFGSADFMNNRR